MPKDDANKYPAHYELKINHMNINRLQNHVFETSDVCAHSLVLEITKSFKHGLSLKQTMALARDKGDGPVQHIPSFSHVVWTTMNANGKYKNQLI